MKANKVFIVVLFVILQVFSFAQTVFETGGIKYSTISTVPNAVAVTYKMPYYEGDIVIPEQVTHEGTVYTVVAISKFAFRYCSLLTSVSLPNTIKRIEYEAFGWVYGLDTMLVPNSVTYVSSRAFASCTNLKTIFFGSSVDTIGDCAFWECTSLTEINVASGNTAYVSVDGVLYDKDTTSFIKYPSARIDANFVIPATVDTIHDYAFNYCNGLTSLVIPNNITYIGTHTFSYATGFSSVTLGESVSMIEDFAFYGSSNLQFINIDQNNQTYASLDGVLYNKSYTTLIVYPEGRNGIFNVPEGVTSIKNFAFYGCSGLTAIEIPNSVTNIGNSAFRECAGLQIIACCAAVPPVLGQNVFEDIYHPVGLFVPRESVQLYMNSTKWNIFGGVIGLDDCGITGIKENEGYALNVFPNPFSDYIHVVPHTNNSSSRFELYDIGGRVLVSIKINHKEALNVAHLPQGMYFFKMISEEKETTGKLIKGF